MSFLLGIAQTGFPEDGDVLAQVRRFATQAAARDVRLLAFPENLMCPRELSTDELAQTAESLEGLFVQGMCAIARELGMWMAFTTFEENPAGGPPFNTAVVADDAGLVRRTYRKCHLYDAHGVRESDRLSLGNELCRPLSTPFCTLGLGICYDLRFPEAVRGLAIGGCDLVLFPAAWHDGPNKLLHWKTLLRARAIENECYVAGICHAGQRYVRQSFVFDPLGNEVVGGSEELLVCEIDPPAVDSARDAMPVFEHRRPELYGSLCQPQSLQ